MCGRYVAPDEAAAERFWHIGRRSGNPLEPRYNVAPTTRVPMIVLTPDGVTERQEARWGLVPFWWKHDTPPTLTFNARSEEAHQKPMWRQSLKDRRCIMPAVGWYEWNEKEKVKGPSGRPCFQPYFHYSPESAVLGIAGLWAVWERKDAEPLVSCALTTKAAAPSVAAIHHRMPVILKREHFAAWLDPATSEHDVPGMIADSEQHFEWYAVSTRVNNARNEGPELMAKLSAATLFD